jgi:hypothetical protein
MRVTWFGASRDSLTGASQGSGAVHTPDMAVYRLSTHFLFKMFEDHMKSLR